jgi:hypothetical protein
MQPLSAGLASERDNRPFAFRYFPMPSSGKRCGR